MKLKTVQTACMAIFFMATTSHALTVSPEGLDKQVEWKLLQNWPTESKTLDMVHSLDGKYVYILNDNSKVQIYNKQGLLKGSIPVASGVSAIDIAPQGETLYLIDNVKNTFSSISVSFVVDVEISGSPFKGPVDAPIIMSIFTDFQCPYCSKIIPLIEQVLDKNPNTVKLVFKNMPLNFHKFAQPAALAALAAQEQGKFWELHDKLFAAKKLDTAVIKELYSSMDLDMEKFEKDMNSSKIKAKLQDDILQAQKAGVTGTPTVFINGRVPRQRSPQGFQALIDDELKKMKEKK